MRQPIGVFIMNQCTQFGYFHTVRLNNNITNARDDLLFFFLSYNKTIEFFIDVMNINFVLNIEFIK